MEATTARRPAPATPDGALPPRPTTLLHTEASRGWGGQEMRILAEARALRQRGWRVLLACQPASRILAEAEEARIPAVAVRMRGSLDPLAFLALLRLMRRQAVQIVHCHSSVDSWLVTLAAKSIGLPVVRGRHVSIPVKRHRALVYHLADRIISSGEEVRRVLVAARVPARKIVAIPAGVDVARFHPAVRGDGVRHELGLVGPVIGIVAMFRASKGHGVFLDAARRVREVLPEARFLLVGDGIGRVDVERRIRALELEGVTTLAGFRRDIPELLAAMDCVVLPALRSEGTPQILPQALALARPVVATTVGGIPEIIQNGKTGTLVPPGDPERLAEAMLAALRNQERATEMACRGRDLVVARFTFARQVAETEAVYQDLLRREG